MNKQAAVPVQVSALNLPAAGLLNRPRRSMTLPPILKSFFK